MNLNRFARRYSTALRFSMTTHENLLTQLASPEHAITRGGGEHLDENQKTFRNVVADSLRDQDRHSEADLVQDHGQHVVVHEGQVKKGQYPGVWGRHNSHLNALYNVVNHIQNNGDWFPFEGIEWSNGHGRPVAGSDTEEHPYGTAEVDHNPDNSVPPYSEHVHWSQLGNHLADWVERELRTTSRLNDDDWAQGQHKHLMEALRNAPYEEPVPEGR